MRFKDVRGLSEARSNDIVLEEMQKAGIWPLVAYPDKSTPVRTTYIGMFLFLGTSMVFTRKPTRWVVRTWNTSPWNDRMKIPGTRIYRHHIENGYPGNFNTEWRIHTQDDLNAFVKRLVQVFGTAAPPHSVDVDLLRTKKLTNNRFPKPIK